MTMTDCTVWHKSKQDTGYGQVWKDGKRWRAHRLVWSEAFGEIPEGAIIDHTCHNEAAARNECEGGISCKHRACVNLNHLRIANASENILGGTHSIGNKLSCPQGHSYKNERNIMIRKNGKRECAECNRQRANAVYARRKLQVA
jgi:hypothetical protein